MEVLEVGPRSCAINRGIPAVLSERPDKLLRSCAKGMCVVGYSLLQKQQEIRHRADPWQAGSAGDRSPARAVSALTQRGISDSILTMSARPHTKVQWKATLKRLGGEVVEICLLRAASSTDAAARSMAQVKDTLQDPHESWAPIYIGFFIPLVIAHAVHETLSNASWAFGAFPLPDSHRRIESGRPSTATSSPSPPRGDWRWKSSGNSCKTTSFLSDFVAILSGTSRGYWHGRMGEVLVPLWVLRSAVGPSPTGGRMHVTNPIRPSLVHFVNNEE
ncbi:hypothetical protein GLOTRDRAFT_91921 [Gloeophyllum trabeum ATCC 11539]|uniref:Uncharacterized protein n=1 Tax=Gloeophyllum trabeum (strain ATCC 11539 / FP-39264 / Madison 617) TaxID=670483 RepID=S7RYR4_GLOTA|nr:uncharacterized protein GLOTRDRAFT_91921 [Gloeophyllum trabeum ATCC 11539]EPQ58534.1 hypothetical protein GLOTRDRAFT_91921 [Gloeophyllum trabeum ATCC 11539]